MTADLSRKPAMLQLAADGDWYSVRLMLLRELTEIEADVQTIRILMAATDAGITQLAPLQAALDGAIRALVMPGTPEDWPERGPGDEPGMHDGGWDDGE